MLVYIIENKERSYPIMSKYTTGEIAKLCNVSIRTVQYYDNRGILIPSEISNGGRRLYTEQDLNRMKIICFLREAGFSLNNISQLLSEGNSGKVISSLLCHQKQEIETEIAESQKKLNILKDICKNLKTTDYFDFASIGDIAHIIKNKENLKKVHTVLLSTAIPFGIVEWTSIILWVIQGIWWPFALYSVLILPYIFWIFNYYWKHVSYICPQCHTIFKPGKKEAFFARHTATTRKLTCPCCNHKSFCVETCFEKKDTSKKM